MTGRHDENQNQAHRRAPTHTSEPFQFAQARPADFEAVAALFEALHRYNAGLDTCFALADDWHALLHERFMSSYNDEHMLWLLAWQAGEPVGLLILRAHTDSLLFRHRHWVELVGIYVSASSRGTSLGRQLVQFAHDWSAARGFCRLQLYVTATNERARAFYRRCGLRPVQEIWRLDVEPADGVPPEDDVPEPLEQEMLEPGYPGYHYLDGGEKRG